MQGLKGISSISIFRKGIDEHANSNNAIRMPLLNIIAQ